MMEIRHIYVISMAKICSVFSAFVGLFFGAVMGFNAFAVQTMSKATEATMYARPHYTVSYNPLWALVFVMLFAIGGFVGGALLAAVYNALAKSIGGIEIER